MADSKVKPIKHQAWAQSWQSKHYIKPIFMKAGSKTKLEAEAFPSQINSHNYP